MHGPVHVVRVDGEEGVGEPRVLAGVRECAVYERHGQEGDDPPEPNAPKSDVGVLHNWLIALAEVSIDGGSHKWLTQVVEQIQLRYAFGIQKG